MAPLDEQALIARYFAALGTPRDDVIAGVGDDAALVAPGPGQWLALATDAFTADVHFPADVPAESVGHKALAVTLSDLAAMAATPAWALVALSLPRIDEAWVAGFADGLHALAAAHGMAVVGGDTIRGPLGATVAAVGTVAPGAALRRAGGRPGDRLVVTGTLGDARLGLTLWQAGERPAEDPGATVVARLHRPEPRLRAGQALAGTARAAIDLSDGLAADAARLAAASGCAARLELARLPLSAAYRTLYGTAREAVVGGDDYELLLALPPEAEAALGELAATAGTPLTVVGALEAGSGVRVVDGDGREVTLPGGYDHFAAEGER